MPKTKNFFKFFRFPIDLSVILLAITAIRIPNFCEPYWYGDEGIYLAIGTALSRGSHLYADIVDHKTPIIYYLAMVPTQLQFRVLLYVWMLVTTIAFYFVAKKLLQKRWPTIVATSIFALFTTLPWFEGNIPNGELFVMGFILVGFWIMSSTRYFTHALIKSTSAHSRITNSLALLITGAVVSLGILTKVPAIFDVAAVFSIGYFHLVHTFSLEKQKFKTWLKNLRSIGLSWMLLAVGVIVPIGLSLIYYISVGSGQDYLFFGLLYNFRYAGTWQLPITNQLLIFFFTLPGKITFLGIVFIVLTALKKYLSSAQQFIFGWTALAMVASLLSNRPYPHYFLQAIPPLSLSIAVVTHALYKQIHKRKLLTTENASVVIGGFLVSFFISLLFVMNVGLYPTFNYYSRYVAMITGSLSKQAYIEDFNYLMKDNYRIAPIIKAHKSDYLFIWGTNPMLYALSDTRPVGKFTVAFHIEDLGVQAETFDALLENQPQFLIVMKDQQSELPGLKGMLKTDYYRYMELDHMIVWKKIQF